MFRLSIFTFKVHYSQSVSVHGNQMIKINRSMMWEMSSSPGRDVAESRKVSGILLHSHAKLVSFSFFETMYI